MDIRDDNIAIALISAFQGPPQSHLDSQAGVESLLLLLAGCMPTGPNKEKSNRKREREGEWKGEIER